MTPPPARLLTERLVLRRWQESDLAPFVAMNLDPEVMRWFPSTLPRERSEAFVVDRADRAFADDGIGLWALERRDTGEFIGFTGCAWQRFDVPCNPSLEIGWRLARAHWGHGFAPEAATAALDDVFGRRVVTDVVSMTVVPNAKSRRVMAKLGMTHDPADDFDHPNLPHWPLRRHVVYRLTAADWSARPGTAARRG